MHNIHKYIIHVNTCFHMYHTKYKVTKLIFKNWCPQKNNFIKRVYNEKYHFA